MCGGPSRGLECPVDADNALSGTGWALAIPILRYGYWEGGIPGGYYLSHHPPGTDPADDLSSCMHPATGHGHPGTCTYDHSGVGQGDPRGR